MQTEKARKQAAFLAEASRQLSLSLDFQSTLHLAARLAIPEISDVSQVTLVDENHNVSNLVTYFEDPARTAWAKDFLKNYPPVINVNVGYGKVLKSGKSELVKTVNDDFLQGIAGSKGELMVLRQQSFRSYMSVPLLARGNLLGTLTLISTADSNRHYAIDDLIHAEEFALSAALAIENSNLSNKAQNALPVTRNLRSPLRRVIVRALSPRKLTSMKDPYDTFTAMQKLNNLRSG